MSREFYINGNLMFVPNNYVIALSFAVNSFYDLKTVQGNVSNRVNLPTTAQNLKNIGYPSDLNADWTETVRKRQECRYVQNGVELIPFGFVEIDSVTKTEISLIITSGNIDFFDLLEGKITDLDLSEQDHVWELSTVIASRYNTSGYIYPVIDYGNLLDGTTKLSIKLMRAAIFVKTLVAKIIEETGFELVNRIEDDLSMKAFYDKLIIPFANEKFLHSKRYINKFKEKNFVMKRDLLDTFSSYGYQTKTYWTKEVSNVSGQFSGNEYLVDQNMNADVSAVFPKLVVTKGTFDADPGAIIRLIVLSGGISHVVSQIETKFTSGFFYPTQEYENQSVSIKNVSLKIGDRVYVTVETKNTSNVAFYPDMTFSLSVSADAVEVGQEIQMEANLPDISKKDFLKFVANLFCAVFQTDSQSKKVYIVPFKKIKDNIENSKDWSDKIADVQSTVYPKLGDYARRNIGAWKKDEAIIDGYGNADLMIDDENLNEVKTLFTFPFSASYEKNVLSSMVTGQIKKIKDITKSDLFEQNTQPRIMLLNKLDTSVVYTDGVTDFEAIGSVPLTFFKSAEMSFLPDLTMQSLFEENYRDFYVVLKDQRRLVQKFNLTENDIAELDFFTPVYIEKYSSFFYLAKVSDYVSGKSTKVELVKLY